MNPVPVLRITDTLADGYALWARSVAPRPAAGAVSAQTFDVEDHMGRRWCLQVDEGRGQRHDVIGTFSGRRRQPQPSLRGEYSVRRWGLRWTLFAMAVPQGDAERAHADAVAAPSISAADSQALDRVGAWLSQPAGLPAARDALGAAFVQAWRESLHRLQPWHAALEQAHDTLVAAPVSTPACWNAWLQGRDSLHVLVELQRLLLGPRALSQPLLAREQGLARLQQLLQEMGPHR